MVNRLCRLKPSLTCKRPLTATGNSSNPAFMPTCHSPVGFLHCSGIFSVLPVSPTISRGPMPLHRALRTVEVSTSPLPEVSIKSTIFGRPSTVVLTCVKQCTRAYVIQSNHTPCVFIPGALPQLGLSLCQVLQ